MLVLTRRIGETLWVGDAALTLRDRRGELVLVSLLVPAGTPVEIGGMPAEAAGAPRPLCWYLHWILCGECMRVGEAEVRLGAAEKRRPVERGGQRQLRISIDAPPALRVRRAEPENTTLAVEAGTACGDAARREAA